MSDIDWKSISIGGHILDGVIESFESSAAFDGDPLYPHAKGDKYGHATLENSIYGVRWLVCRRCGMRSADVREVGDVTECADAARCTRALLGQPLGGKQWSGDAPNSQTDWTTDILHASEVTCLSPPLESSTNEA